MEDIYINNIERRDLELPYICDEMVFEEQKVTRRLMQEFNNADPSDFDTFKKIAKELLSKSGDGLFQSEGIQPMNMELE